MFQESKLIVHTWNRYHTLTQGHIINLPESRYDHENIPNDAKYSNEEVEETEEKLNIGVEYQGLVGVAGHVHHYSSVNVNSFTYLNTAHYKVIEKKDFTKTL